MDRPFAAPAGQGPGQPTFPQPRVRLGHDAKRSFGPLAIVVPGDVAVHECGVAACVMVVLRAIVQVVAVVVWAQVSLVKASAMPGLADQQCPRRLEYGRPPEPGLRDDQAIHVVGHEPSWLIERRGAEPDRWFGAEIS